MINENIIKGKWKEIKGSLQKAWGDLTNDELDKVKGDITSLTGLIQQKYGMSVEEAKKRLNDVLRGYSVDEDEDITDNTDSSIRDRRVSNF